LSGLLGRIAQLGAAAAVIAMVSTGVARAAPSEKKDPAETQLRRRLEEILRSPRLDDAVVGVHVRDVLADRSLFDRNSTKLFNPASNMKLVTTAAALYHLGPSYRFRTTAYRDRSLRNGVLKGNLYIKGRGDPTLTNERLFGLVNEIALHSIEKVEGNLVVDDTYFDAVSEGPGWEQERSDKSYAPPMGGLSVNYGTFSVRVMPGDRVGSAARVSIYPDVPSIEVASSVYTRGRGARRRVWVGTTRGENGQVRVTVRGAIPLGDIDGVAIYRRVYDPSLYAGETIKRLLEMRGVEVTGRVIVAPKPARGTVPVASHFSRPLAEIISTLNKYSNNFIAEQILKTLGAELREAPGTWEKGVAAVGDFFDAIGIPKDGLVMGNGSGLNDINRMTPRQVTKLLAAMYKRVELRPEFVASLAVAGVSGTITSRFADSAAESRLRAKTGSLRGVSALSGYVVTRDNRLLAFSVMMNDYPGRARAMWRVQDEIGTTLAELDRTNYIAQP